MIGEVWKFLTDGANWRGTEGIGTRLATHLWVSLLAVLAAVVVAGPVGLAFGHRRRGSRLSVSVANLSRAIPSLAILAFVVAAGGGIGFLPTWVAMFALALPPIFVGAVTGVTSVDPSVVDAAAGMGMRPWQQLARVEFPLALPLVISGIRVASSQVISTATLGAFVGYNTLGRFITVGRANRDDGMLYGGVLLIVLAALSVDWWFRILESVATRWRR
jgi:osmoprotectant transport system permease protein